MTQDQKKPWTSRWLPVGNDILQGSPGKLATSHWSNWSYEAKTTPFKGLRMATERWQNGSREQNFKFTKNLQSHFSGQAGDFTAVNEYTIFLSLKTLCNKPLFAKV